MQIMINFVRFRCYLMIKNSEVRKRKSFRKNIARNATLQEVLLIKDNQPRKGDEIIPLFFDGEMSTDFISSLAYEVKKSQSFSLYFSTIIKFLSDSTSGI